MNVRPRDRLRTPRLAPALMLLSLVTWPVAAGCRGSADPPPVAPPIENGPHESTCPDQSPAGQVKCKQTNTCEAACDGLRRAECAEGFATPGGHTCEETCRSTDGSNRSWPKACWAEARTRDDITRCGKARCLPMRDASP